TAAATSGPAPRPDVAAAVDEVKRLLGEGSITRAVDILGSILPAAAAEHGEHSPVVRILRKQYVSTLLDDGQYRRALPELRRLADDRSAEAGPADGQVLGFRYDAALCLEQLGEAVAALEEYRALLPYYEQHGESGYGADGYRADGYRADGERADGERRATAGADPGRAFEIRRRIGHLLLSTGDHTGAWEQLRNLLLDTERAYGPYHPLPAEIRRALDRQQQFRG
ncbi:hypothetical protein DVH02_33600, partial [Streptomyces corynorhini]